MLTTSQVVLLFSGSTAAAMGLLLVILSRRYSAHINGLREWGTGLLVVAGTVMTAFFLRGIIGQMASVVMGNIVVVFGIMIINQGARRFFEDKSPHNWATIGVFLAVFISAALWSAVIQPSATLRTVVFMVGGSIVLIDLLLVVFRHRKYGTGAVVLGIALICLLSVRTVKLVAALIGMPVSESIFDATPSEIVLTILPSVLVPVATLAFILMALEHLIHKLNQTIRHDDLTGALNKTSLYTEIEREIVRSIRYTRPTSVLMIDLDNFKAVNDNMGHLKGDQTLKDVVRQICKSVRETDMVARFGGDEFAVLLTETDIDQARLIAQRILGEVQTILPPYCGLSIGISSLRSHGETADSLLHRADQALYKAKSSGKNQMALA